AVKLLFEREDHECLVYVLTKKLDTSLAPGPELRAHIIDDRNATFLHLASHAPVECGRIDDDGQVGTMSVRLGNEAAKQSPNFRKMAKDLGDPDDSEVFSINDGAASGSTHLFAADTEELKFRGGTGEGARPSPDFVGLGGGSVRADEPGAQSLHKLRAIHFAGGFACRDQNSHRALYRGASEGGAESPPPFRLRSGHKRRG